jgi:predicted nucleotidyltransferase
VQRQLFLMNSSLQFPTNLHHDAAAAVAEYFRNNTAVDTVLIVNSCARGQAVADSDLDLAILVAPGTSHGEMKRMEEAWSSYSTNMPAIVKFRQSSQFSHVHLDVIDGKYAPGIIEPGEPIDYFEVEIGNQICYSVPLLSAGAYFLELRQKWLPFYDDDLRLKRLTAVQNACSKDLDHVPSLVNRELYFHAFYILTEAFRKYLQAIFLANRIYPIAYNKWIREQIVKWLNKPGLYPKLLPILSVSKIESNEMNEKATMLRELLMKIADE